MKAICADITTLNVDAIVNAAKPSLLGGGGVDGAIHQAAGPRLLQECQTLGGCYPGEAKITRAYDLPARYVIHTVGPVWKGGHAGEAETLANCYLRCLEIAHEYGLRSIAFPSISTGAYGYPVQQAALTAVSTVRVLMAESNRELDVTFCCFSPGDLEIYKEALSNATID